MPWVIIPYEGSRRKGAQDAGAIAGGYQKERLAKPIGVIIYCLLSHNSYQLLF